MKNKIILTFLALLCCLYLHAQIPGTITYQGYLTDATGKPKSGTHKLTFNFYDGATVVATRVISTVNVTNGLFTEIIGKDASGENVSLPLTVWSKPITVGIAVDAEAELPKISLTSMPYAFTSQLANSVDGANITGTVNASKIGGTLIASNIPALDAGKITTGTLSNALLDADLQDLADGSLSGGKVGTGISGTNITTGTLTGALVGSGVSASNVTTGTLAGSLVGTGVSASNVTTGTLPSSVLDPEIADLAYGTLASLNVSGFTQLGTNSPLIKMVKLTGTTPGAEGFDTGINFPSGVTQAKIISVIAMIDKDNTAAEVYVPPGYSIENEAEFGWYLTSTQIRLIGAATNSGNIISQPYRIVIIYEQ